VAVASLEDGCLSYGASGTSKYIIKKRIEGEELDHLIVVLQSTIPLDADARKEDLRPHTEYLRWVFHQVEDVTVPIFTT